MIINTVCDFINEDHKVKKLAIWHGTCWHHGTDVSNTDMKAVQKAWGLVSCGYKLLLTC